MCQKNSKAAILGDGVGADSKPVVKKESNRTCNFCRINGKNGGPATGKNGQNENREGEQILAEVMEG